MVGQSRRNWLDFFCKGTFLRSWFNNLMVFKKSGLGLDLKNMSGLATLQVLNKVNVNLFQITVLA